MMKKGLLPDAAHFTLGVLITVAVEAFLHHNSNVALVVSIGFAGVALVIVGRVIYVLSQGYDEIRERVAEITPRIGLRTRLLEFPAAYGEAGRAIQSAKEEILTVTNWALPYDTRPSDQAEMTDYYSTVLDGVLTRSIVYERIIQLDRPGEEKTQRNKPLLSHLRRCIEERDETSGRTRIGVFRCPPSALVSFLLVDQTILFFQFDEYNNRKECFQVSKCLIVEDNTKEVASAFRELFEGLKRRSDKMTLEDLAKIESGGALLGESAE
jgi:hypothetical protein